MSDAVVQLSNHTSRDIFIRGDPNWDDQILMLDGRPKTGLHRLAPGRSAELAVPAEGNGEIDEYALGVILADGRDFDYGSAGAYQMTIGRQPETGLLGVTDESVINEPAVRYSATSDGARAMRMEFVDARDRAPVDSRSLSF